MINLLSRLFIMSTLVLLAGCDESALLSREGIAQDGQMPVNREYTIHIPRSGIFLPTDIDQRLDRIVDEIDKLPVLYGVDVVGHTDNYGGELENLLLSLRRSGAVGELLVEKGLNDGLVSFDGFGELFPVADNQTEAGRAENRRIEIRVSGLDWVPSQHMELVTMY